MLALSLLGAAAWGQAANADGTSTVPFNGLAHTAIRVANLQASMTFYEKLGFEKAFSAEKNGS